MTTGSEPVNPDSVNPSHRAIHPRDDRETLSALFDGALPGDAARFALKRLDHDVSWRETCGRWQLIGDALRGQATTAAPSDFAGGVMRALNAEGHGGAAATSSSSHAQSPMRVAPRYRWVGGAALAASVAMAAVLWVRPHSQDATSDAQVAASTAGPAASTQRAVAAQASVATVPGSAPAGSTSPDLAGSAPVAAIAVAAAASRPAAARRSDVGARRVPQGVSTSVAASSNAVATEVAAAQAATHQPFHPPAFQPPGDEITTRPWPRAVLPEAGAGALTVGFGTAPAPSFYPFEPRLPASEKPPANESQR